MGDIPNKVLLRIYWDLGVDFDSPAHLPEFMVINLPKDVYWTARQVYPDTVAECMN